MLTIDRSTTKREKIMSTTKPLKVVDIPQVVDKNIKVVDIEPKKVVDTEIKMSTTEK